MKLKDAIFIALIFLGIGIIAGYFLHGYPAFESGRNWIIKGVSLTLAIAVVFELVGLLKEWFKERRENHAKKEEKRIVSRRLLSEIDRNQKLLKPLSDSVAKVLDRYLFSWDNVPGNDSETLIAFFRDEFDIGWAENAEILKPSEKNIHIYKDENSAEITIDEEKEKATLKIGDGITYNLRLKKKNGKLNIYVDSNAECSEEDKFPKKLNFNRIIYSESSDKLGLLDDESRNKIDQHYPELNDIGKEYDKLELIHGVSYSFLRYLDAKDAPEYSEICEFLRRAEKVYDLGEELIKCLKE